MSIDKLLGELSMYDENSITPALLKSYNDLYSEIIEQCEFNHCKIDELWHKVWNSWLSFFERALSLVFWIVFAIFHYGGFFAAVLIPIVFSIYFYLIR